MRKHDEMGYVATVLALAAARNLFDGLACN